MPKRADRVFSDPADAPYLSVVSPSTHDMPTLRGWWREDPQVTADFAWRMMGEAFPPLELTAELATRIIRQHLTSPAMWAVFPLQDLLAMDEDLRHPDPDAERINVPADPDHRWRFRMHLTLGELAAADEFTSHMAVKAAERALEQAGLAAADLELIILATITPDTPTPATACYVQQALGATRAVAFDISAACSGFLYAMKISKRLISDGAFKNALIIGADKLSSITNWEDRSTCVLFGDGAGAAVLRAAKPGEGAIVATEMGTDGSLTHILAVPGGGSACPITAANVNDHLQTLGMQG